MSDAMMGASPPWYRSLNRSQWNTLIASNLGWLFDGYETYALIISIGVALSTNRHYADPRDVVAAASEMKTVAKSQPGSYVAMDRRTEHSAG